MLDDVAISDCNHSIFSPPDYIIRKGNKYVK